MLHALIMAGGSGTRFWPASRTSLPKQLLRLVGSRTMLQATVDRLDELVPRDKILIMTNQALIPQLRGQLPELGDNSFVGEPCKRDTAPCIGLAAALVQRQDPQATIVVMPADHVITPATTFREAVQQAVKLVDNEPRTIATFGVRPTYPAETFGYIERGEPGPSDATPAKVFEVRKFHEKPAAEVAARYLASGEYYWNSGIFVWKAQTILDALAEFEPRMHSHLCRIADAAEGDDFPTVFEREFAAIEGKSIDFAVMEKYQGVVVLEAPFQWDDLGSWQSLARRSESDDDGNTVVGKHLGIDTRGCIVRSEDEHLIVTLGLEDCIVVHTPDATLVARKHDEEAIRDVVKILGERGWREYL